MPGVVAKGLSTCDLPRKALFGCDDTGVQLFHATDGRSPIEGEGYPYHIIHSWSRYEPAGGRPAHLPGDPAETTSVTRGGSSCS